MGRELRRKQAKKEGKSLQREMPTEKNELKSLLIITLVLIVIIAVIYLLSALFVTKELDWFNNDDDKEIETLVDNTILASETFKQNEEVYYVYFYDYDDENTEITSSISSVLSAEKVYKVDTGSALNNKYVSEESNKKAKKLADLKVKAPTIVKISGEQITAYYEGDEITEKLK